MKSLRILMLSYERGFLDPASVPSSRLRGMVTDDIRVTTVILSGSEKGERVDGENRYIAPGGRDIIRFCKGFFFARREVRRAQKAGESVLISSQDPFISGKLAFLLSRFCGVPYEIQEHGDFFSGEWAREKLSHRFLICLGKFVLRRADSVRVVSERVRRQLIDRIHVPADRIYIRSVVEDISWHLGQPIRNVSGAPLIVVPCRFVHQKGLDILLRSLSILRREGASFCCRLIGSGSQEEKLREMVKDLDLSSSVIIDPWASQESLWGNADLFVCSSRYEGWGRTIVEAMAAGVPIVTTDVGCVGSLFRPQIDGRVVQVGDVNGLANAIREQIAESDRRAWMARNARERVREFLSQDRGSVFQKEAWQHVVEKESRLSFSGGKKAWMWGFGLVLFAILVRGISLALFGHVLGEHRDGGFFTLVTNWFKGYGYSFIPQDGCASAYRSPGYLFFLTAVYGIFGFANFTAQAVVQNIFSVGIVYLVYRLGWTISKDRRIGLVAGFLTAVHPYTFYHYTQYYHTFLQAFLLLALLLVFYRLLETKKMMFAVWGGVAIAFLAYVQGTILPATALLSLWLLYEWRKEWRRAIIAIGIMAFVSILLIVPWTYRNWKVFHEFVPLTTDLGLAMYKGNTENYPMLLKLGYPHELLDEEYHPENPLLVRYTYLPEVQEDLRANGGIRESILWTEWHPREPSRPADTCAQLSTMSEPEYNSYWLGKTKDWFVANYWTDGYKLQIDKAMTMWSPRLYPWKKYGAAWSFGNQGIKATLAQWGYLGYVLVIEILAIAGAILASRKKNLRRFVPIFIVFAVYTFMHTIFVPYTKYRIPLDHLVVILSAIPIVWLWDWRKKRSPFASRRLEATGDEEVDCGSLNSKFPVPRSPSAPEGEGG